MVGRGGFREGAGRKPSGNHKVVLYVDEQEEKHLKDFLTDLRQHVFLKKEKNDKGAVYSMAGNLPRLSRQKQDIEDQHLGLVRVAIRCDTKTGMITEDQRKAIEEKITKCDLAIEQCSEIIGELRNQVMPSSNLTRSRDKWSRVQEDTESLRTKIREARDADKNILSRGGWLPLQ